VEVAPTFASSLANANNHDLTANVHHNYGQINVNSASMYLDEVRKEDLPEEMRQELDQMLAQFQCDFLYQVAISKKNKSDSDLSNSSVIMTTEPNGVHSESIASKESSLAVKEHINQKEIAMLDFLKPELSYT
jgi:cation transport regulator ChaB